MCRFKYYTISEKFGWHLAAVTALMFLILGAVSFGYGLKLMEYAEKKDLTPIFAGVPMLITGVLGTGVALSRKKCIVTSYAIMCVIVSMLSIHMNYRFMVKEFSSIPLYKRQCKLSHVNDQQHCNEYAGTVILCCVAVSMVPVAVAGFLACLVANKTLKKKNCYLMWFTFAKVVPARQINNRKTRNKRNNNNKSVELTKYTLSAEYIGEETLPQSEYLPRIPDFMELAIHNSNLGFRDSLMLENEQEHPLQRKKKIGRSHFSKSLENLEQNQSREKLNIKDVRGSNSNLSAKKDDAEFDQKKAKIDSYRLAHSDVDLRFIEQEHINRKHDRQNPEYYDSTAEYWIEKMVDNLKYSRSRLHGVSDEEDLDSDSEPCSDKMNAAGFSTTKPLLSKEDKESKDDCVLKTSEDKASSFNRPLLSTNTKENKDSVTLERSTGNNDCDLGFSTSVHCPPQENLDKQNTTSYFEENENGTCYSVDIEDCEAHRDDDKETSANKANIQSEVLTPPGLTTPMGGCHSPNGRLQFEFDKVPNATTEHARKNWIEFEGEEDAKKLIQGEMSSSQYNDLTSYIM